MGYNYGGGYYGAPYPSPIQNLQGENYHLRENNGGINEGTGKGAAIGAALGLLVPGPFKILGVIGGALLGGGLGNKFHDMDSTNGDAHDNGILDGSPRYGIFPGGGYGQQFGGGYGQQFGGGYNPYGGGRA